MSHFNSQHPDLASVTAEEMFHCQASWSGGASDIKKHKRGLVNFRHSFAALCLSKSQRGWGTAEQTKGRGKTTTSSTTTQILGGCATIYNLPSLLCDSVGERKEGETQGDWERG